MPPENPSSRPPASADEVEPVEPGRLDAGATAEDHLGALPSIDLGGATRPRGEGEIPFDPDEPEPEMKGSAFDPLDGIPSVPADRIAGVPESQVTDAQGEKPTSGAPSGSSEHPPASTAP